MYNVTVRYGIDRTTRVYDYPPTFGTLRSDDNLRAELGYGDNVKFLVSGVEMGDAVQVPPGTEVFVETACNQKAYLAI